MKEKCNFCERELRIGEIVVVCQGEDERKLFCAGEESPLEPESCAGNYVQKNPDGLNKSYFFVRLGEY